ncbi:hypothetical protein B0A58_03535 [Flavobacterium branchiophilum NBRC 15030 = ATCC 35035]|nr:hypothetical protein B0A58_03535 [Flavobacterium branchiophilum NBRC 15030 = ATCC 35035]
MKPKLSFIIVLLVLYYFNFIGRIHGLYANFITTGVINVFFTYYLIKTNPFKKLGLFLIFIPFVILSFTVICGIYLNIAMPGVLGYYIYVIATSTGLFLHKYNHLKKIILLIYVFFFTLSIYCYSDMLNLYYSIYNKNDNINKEFPELNIKNKFGKKVNIQNGHKILIIDLWSITCGNCIDAFPKFEKVKNDFENDNQIEFISINIYNSWNDVLVSEKYLKGFTFTNYYCDQSIFSKLGFNSVPNYIIVGKDRKIKYFGSLNIKNNENYNNIYNLIKNEK